jgi:hypothetical protein
MMYPARNELVKIETALQHAHFFAFAPRYIAL